MMKDSKPAALMDEWRNCLCNGNGDIFEIIKTAIVVAASDHPVEFKTKRHKIAQVVFSDELIMGSGCDNRKKQSEDETKVVGEDLKMKENLDKSGDIESESVLLEPKSLQLKSANVNDHVYSQGVAEVLRMKKILDKSGESEMVMCDLLTKLQSMELSMKTLEVTTIGKTVSPLKKHASEKVREIAVTLVKAWKRTVDEWLKKQSNVVEPKSTNVNKTTEKKLEKTPKIGNGGVMEKLEATKRKLQEGYEKAENSKKQRRIQVMDLHQVTKQGLLPQMSRCMKPCNKKQDLLPLHNRRNVYGRC